MKIGLVIVPQLGNELSTVKEKKESKTPPTPLKKGGGQIQDVIDFWETEGVKLSQNHRVTANLKKQIQRCLNDDDWFKTFKEAVLHANNCPYARGEVKPWKLTLRWITENRGKVDRVLDWHVSEQQNDDHIPFGG